MKARVKATGEIVEVNECGQAFKDMRMDYMDTKGRCYKSEDLDFNDNTPFDYWTRLEHTYVGMFMKSFLDNFDGTTSMEILADDAIKLAHALVEKMKEERK